MHPVDEELVVQMRPGGYAGRADITDNLTLANPSAFPYAIGVIRHVRVQRAVAAAMLNDDRMSVTALAPTMHDAPVARGANRCSGRCRVIYASVRPAGAVDRVQAIWIEDRKST